MVSTINKKSTIPAPTQIYIPFCCHVVRGQSVPENLKYDDMADDFSMTTYPQMGVANGRTPPLEAQIVDASST